MTMVRVKAPEVLWQDVDDELILLDNRHSLYLKVAGAGVALWPLIVDGASRDRLAAHLVKLHAIDSHRARSDVDAFVDDLLKNDLVTEVT